MRAALDRVGEPHKTAILLAYFQGLTNSELAEATGVALGTAKTRLRDGLRKLHRELVSAEDQNGARLSEDSKAKAQVRKL